MIITSQCNKCGAKLSRILLINIYTEYGDNLIPGWSRQRGMHNGIKATLWVS